MSFGSRNKGSVAEREIAKMLSEWWGQIEPGINFVRTPLSGGWGGPELRAGFQASGDIMTTSKVWPWAIEVKRREGWVWKNLLASKPSPVWKWWQQAEGQALEMGKEPLMFFRHNKERWHVMLRGNDIGINGWKVDRGTGRKVFAESFMTIVSEHTVPSVIVQPWDLAQHELLEYGRQRLREKAGRKKRE